MTSIGEEGCREIRTPLYIADESIKWCSLYGKQFSGIFKKLNRITI